MSYDEHLISMAGGDGDSADQLAAIEARANAATPGEWEPYNRGIGYEVHLHGIPVNDNLRETFNKQDAEFIANARTDVPALLAHIRDQQAKLDRILKLADWAGKRGWQIAPAALRSTINEASA